MLIRRIRWSFAAAIVLFVGVGLTTAPVRAAPMHVDAQSDRAIDFGKYSAMQRMLSGRTGPATGSSAPAIRASQAPLTFCPAGWNAADSPNGTWNNVLGGISAIGPNDIWAVGNYESPTPTQFGKGEQNLAEHWDGSRWKIVPMPQPSPDGNLLTDVAAITTSDAWAVGGIREGPPRGAAYHWDGATWTQFASLPFTANNGPFLFNSVHAFASNNVWAVGWQLSGLGPYQITPLVEHYDGSNWTIIPSPSTGAGDNVLNGVGGTSSTDLYAVGYYDAAANGPKQGFIVHSIDAGAHWTTATIASGLSGDEQLISVAASSTTDALAVGYDTGATSRLVALHTVDDGASWQSMNTAQATGYNALADVVAANGSTYDMVGFDATSQTASVTPLFASWTGGIWTVSAAQSVGHGSSPLYALAVLSSPPSLPNDVWAVGLQQNSQQLQRTLIEQFSDMASPTGVTASAGDQQAAISWTMPCADAGAPVTSYTITAYDGCTVQGYASVPAPASGATYPGLSNGVPYSFTVQAVTMFGPSAQSYPTTAVTPHGAATPMWVSACSTQQYTLANNDGATWGQMDTLSHLTVTFTPPADSYAVMSGNADLWTVNAGYNQDIGIEVSGGTFPTTPNQPEGWKESGGFAGTFSPNAAYVQTVISVKASTIYTATLVWKANKQDAGTIVAGAGPIGTAYSPTSLTVRLIPVSSAVVFNVSSTQQYHLTNSDGNSWLPMDATNLSVPFTVPSSTPNWDAFVSSNSDLWTANAGYNQDIGISMTGIGYPTSPSQPEVWKESGGFAGTFSPNAAFANAAVPVTGGQSYTAKVVWKANQPDSGTIFAGAGPIGGQFSPTSLTVILLPVANAALNVKTSQYSQVNSDGAYWQEVDPSLNLMLSPPANTSYVIGANADLWTTVAGYNQDVGIMVSGGAYGFGTLVAWKESGGFAGTFSPNAAFVQTLLHLQSGNTYKVWAVWKANIIAKVSNSIYIGAGPINLQFSPASLTATQLSQP